MDSIFISRPGELPIEREVISMQDIMLRISPTSRRKRSQCYHNNTLLLSALHPQQVGKITSRWKGLNKHGASLSQTAGFSVTSGRQKEVTLTRNIRISTTGSIKKSSINSLPSCSGN